MKRLFILSCLIVCITAIAHAQTYTQHLQQKAAGKGSVVVTQSEEIDKLVNTANVNPRQQEAAHKPTAAEKPTSTAVKTTPTAASKSQKFENVAHSNPTHNNAAHHGTEPRHEATQHHESTLHHESTQRHESTQHHNTATETAEAEAPVVDMSKKVMRRSYKTNGYRVQVFAGGNSRNDKIKAQQAGNAVKAAFPSQPIYVHFYSPRWICRMGNYRTYDEANAILQQVKKLGYKQACIVKGKISVAY